MKNWRLIFSLFFASPHKKCDGGNAAVECLDFEAEEHVAVDAGRKEKKDLLIIPYKCQRSSFQAFVPCCLGVFGRSSYSFSFSFYL